MKELIEAIEASAVALRQHAQNHSFLEDQHKGAIIDNERMQGEIAYLEKSLAAECGAKEDAQKLNIKQAQQIGELKATLKEVLAQNMQIAARATEMLKDLEDKPKTTLLPEMTQEEFSREQKAKVVDAPPNWRADVVKLVDEERKEIISRVNEGEKITVDPQNNLGEKRTKYWYRCYTNGVVPSNWDRLPGVEVQVKDGRLVFIRFIAPKPKEVESQKPFCNPDPSIGADISPKETAFNGETIPKFLAKGPAHHDDQRRQS